ncbi:chromodomain-helicase-DNA-binding protein 1 [Plasmodium inui San Antonio 1]|uniref:Chromodomain-helicase-DNA-binding protein 1 n=1 Tax=Plasmodium inui San Antonio 1 TaxID=1237626 RepID=W7ALP3_9APIC|nr:chromodomain-helicase-DNA-binding protein 1 [Plasmodium inui San Antonio 1]EUD66246.1 chromodomain-helicase-DNA-binding protein 1 [Plasmodium inui San Antonio 1]
MNQHSMNKLAKKYVKKHKKLLKVVKKITQLGEQEKQQGVGDLADQGSSTSPTAAATADSPTDKWKSSEIKKKINEFILFIGNHISKLDDVCPDKECSEILSSSGWDYVSKFLGETSETLKEKYAQGQREWQAKEPNQLEQSRDSEDGGNFQGSITEDDLATFFFSKRISSMCRLHGVEEAEEEDEDHEDDDELSHDQPKRAKSMTSINYDELQGTTSTFTVNGRTRRSNNFTGGEDNQFANDSNGDYPGMDNLEDEEGEVH